MWSLIKKVFGNQKKGQKCNGIMPRHSIGTWKRGREIIFTFTLLNDKVLFVEDNFKYETVLVKMHSWKEVAALEHLMLSRLFEIIASNFSSEP